MGRSRKLHDQEAEIAILKEVVANLKVDLSHSLTAQESHTKAITSIQKKSQKKEKALKKEIETLKASNEKLAEETKALQLQNVEHCQTIAELTVDNTRLLDANLAAVDEIAALRDQTEKLSDEIETLKLPPLEEPEPLLQLIEKKSTPPQIPSSISVDAASDKPIEKPVVTPAEKPKEQATENTGWLYGLFGSSAQKPITPPTDPRKVMLNDM